MGVFSSIRIIGLLLALVASFYAGWNTQGNRLAARQLEAMKEQIALEESVRKENRAIDISVEESLVLISKNNEISQEMVDAYFKTKSSDTDNCSLDAVGLSIWNSQ